MKYTFKSGAIVEGTVAQIQAVGKVFKEEVKLENIEGEWDAVPEGYYFSAKKGALVSLKTMNPMYLRNALLKRTETYIDALRTQKDIDDNQFLNTYVGLTEDKVVSALFAELANR